MPLVRCLTAALLCLAGFSSLHSQPPAGRSTTPADRLREPSWAARHQAVLAAVQAHPDMPLLLIGDSITNNYDKAKLPDENFAPRWQTFYAARRAFNLGFSGDATENVLWRLEHGEVAGLHPKAAVVLIGTNNTGHEDQTAAETEAGIDAVVGSLESRLPETKILLLAILPSDISADKSARDHAVNLYLAGHYKGDARVTFLDVGSIFYKDGALDTALFYDPRLPQHRGALHPDTSGQRMMAQAIEPTLARLMGDAPIALQAGAAEAAGGRSLLFSSAPPESAFRLIADGRPAPLSVDLADSATVQVAAHAFAEDLRRVSGAAPLWLSPDQARKQRSVVLVGTIGHSALIDDLIRRKMIDVSRVQGRWESAVTAVVEHPFPGVERALVVAGSDRRGTAYALFAISRRMGVSPWYWWADVPVVAHRDVAIAAGVSVQSEPSVRYRGIFLNDEDWGLRPWAAGKMDPTLHNVGPHTYERICELLLRLNANLLWPAMHPGTLAFHAVPGNAEVADRWGIVMGSSHSEALLRNNVGEWDLHKDGAWNYQTNRDRMQQYWSDGLQQNARYENEYTVGLRGLHDSGLEATGSVDVKARLVESAMQDQRALLAKWVSANVASIPQVMWLYKESIDLYRAGMTVPPDVTLGWTDDNFGYLRQLPNAQEQKRPGGSALYYHVSYWGRPHDYLWLCTTPPALMQEELTKAYDHGVRRLWVLNVGDLKPAESDMDDFLNMAWNEPAAAARSQHEFLAGWAVEQFGAANAEAVTALWEQAYRLNFVRKPEFMGFNGYDDGVKHTAFNPLAWGDENRQRLHEWSELVQRVEALGAHIDPAAGSAYFELVAYPIKAAAAQNAKFLELDRRAVELENGNAAAATADLQQSQAAYDRIQSLTAEYNGLEHGKWEGMMSADPRDRHVFDAPASLIAEQTNGPIPWTAAAPAEAPVAQTSGRFAFHEIDRTVSINATQFDSSKSNSEGEWKILPDLGVSGGSVVFGDPGLTPAARWIQGGEPGQSAPSLEYHFSTQTEDEASLHVYLLPTFPVDSDHRLRYAVQIDDRPAIALDASGTESHPHGITPWEQNVLSNAAIQTVALGRLAPGPHTFRVFYGDPGVIFEHLTVTFPGAPTAYPVAP